MIPTIRPSLLLAASTVAAASSVAAANITGAYYVTYWATAEDFTGTPVTKFVADIYLVSDDPQDVLLNIFNSNWNGPFPQQCPYQDFLSTGWKPNNMGSVFDKASLRQLDSFVTIGGFPQGVIKPEQIPGAGDWTGTDTEFGGHSVCFPYPNAGWYTGNPPLALGQVGEVVDCNGGFTLGVMIARFSHSEPFSLDGSELALTWNQGPGTEGNNAWLTVEPGCQLGILDCNQNGVEDEIDVTTGTSADCNGNLVPDECDIGAGTPDANLDGIPDICQGQLVFEVPARFSSITSAIDAAPDGSRIQLAPGNYAEAIDLGTRNLEIVGNRKNPSSTTLETPGLNRTVVTIAGGQDASTLIAGVLIENGISSTPEPGSPANSVGGGLYIDDSSPVIEDCIVSTNQATRGGGAYLRFSNAVFRRTVFEGNVSAGDGGGIWWHNGVITLEDCTIRNNQAQGDGAGLHVSTNGGSITGGSVTGNLAADDGAGLWWQGFLQTIVLADVDVSNNIAGGTGGGVFSPDGFFGIEPSGLRACQNFPNQVRGPYTIVPGVTNTVCRCGDLNGDGLVNGVDLGLYLAVGGNPCPELEDCPADITFDGDISGADLGRLLGDWGRCP